MNRQQKIRLAAVLLAAVLLGTAAGLNLPARVRSGEVVAALSAWTDEVSENLFAVSAAPGDGRPGGNARAPGRGRLCDPAFGR